MILRELEKAVKKAQENMKNKRNTEDPRLEWRRRYKALLRIAEFVKKGDWTSAEQHEKVIFILSKGYEAAEEKYGVSRTTLSKVFNRANSELENFIPELIIRLIMQG